jgi:hypothetical protein
MTERTIPPGSGTILRRTYLNFIVGAAVLTAVFVPSVLTLTVTQSAHPTVVTIAVAAVFFTITTLLLLAGTLRARGAVRHDTLTLPASRTAEKITRTATISGWTGAAAILATGAVQQMIGVDLALPIGIGLAVLQVIPAVMATTATRLLHRINT